MIFKQPIYIYDLNRPLMLFGYSVFTSTYSPARVTAFADSIFFKNFLQLRLLSLSCYLNITWPYVLLRALYVLYAPYSYASRAGSWSKKTWADTYKDASNIVLLVTRARGRPTILKSFKHSWTRSSLEKDEWEPNSSVARLHPSMSGQFCTQPFAGIHSET